MTEAEISCPDCGEAEDLTGERRSSDPGSSSIIDIRDLIDAQRRSGTALMPDELPTVDEQTAP